MKARTAMGSKKPSGDLKDIAWPKCSGLCLAIECLGAGECESVCPEKFKEASDGK